MTCFPFPSIKGRKNKYNAGSFSSASTEQDTRHTADAYEKQTSQYDNMATNGNTHPRQKSDEISQRHALEAAQRQEVEAALDAYYDHPQEFVQRASVLLGRKDLIPGFQATLNIFMGYHYTKMTYLSFRKALETCDASIKRALERHRELPEEVIALRRSAMDGLRGEEEFLMRQEDLQAEHHSHRIEHDGGDDQKPIGP